MKLRHPLCLATVAGCSSLVASPAVFAQDNDAEEIVVTASRGSESLSHALAPVTVIDREDIERLQSQDVQDLFVGLPGLVVTSNGGPGKSTSLFVRGTESDHVLVLVDGIKVGSATSGGTPFEQIPVDQIERIEIVRGPRSSLYGSEAIGGVIQIFTRRGPRSGAVPSFAAGRGTHGDSRLEAGLRGGKGPLWYSLGVSGRHTDGINVRTIPPGNQPDRDGYESRAGSARVGYTFSETAELAASFLRSEGDNRFDGNPNSSNSTTQVLGSTLRFAPLSAWQVNLSAGQSRDESDNYNNGVFTTRFDTKRDYFSWLNEVTVARGQTVSLGADYQDDQIDSTTVYAERARDNTGVFGLYRGEFGSHEFQISARQDDNEAFGKHETGGAAYGYRFGNGLRATVSYGTAFKAPTFNELYFPGFGSPDVEPEESRNTEVSLAGSTGRYGWAVNVFRNEIDDLIGSGQVPVPGGGTALRASNLDKALITGVEGQLGARWGAFRAQTYVTWLEPENDSGGANDGNTLPRRRETTARLDLDYDWRRLSTGMTLFGASDGYDNAANTADLPGYATLAIRTALQVTPEWQFQVEGRNVLDKHYQTIATYELPGATFMATLRYTPPS